MLYGILHFHILPGSTEPIKMGGLAKGLSFQLQKMLQLDAENVLENVCWEIKGYTVQVCCVVSKFLHPTQQCWCLHLMSGERNEVVYSVIAAQGKYYQMNMCWFVAYANVYLYGSRVSYI